MSEFLSLHIGGTSDRPERILLIGRPRNGRVRVREWNTGTLNTGGATRDIDAAQLLTEVEAADSAHLPMKEEMYAVRRWLEG